MTSCALIPSSSSSPAIGIDLGTTYSCVGVWKDNQVQIIANDQGNRTTPSYVSFSSSSRLVGELAKAQASTNPHNTIFDAKRLIGRKFTDPTVQNDIKLFPFKVLSSEEASRQYGDVDINNPLFSHPNLPLIQVSYHNQMKFFSPEQISAFVLSKMKTTAENYLNTSVHSAVITVPAYFNDAQRQATRDAGMIAGLNVLRIINEPTAAAIAYGLSFPTSTSSSSSTFTSTSTSASSSSSSPSSSSSSSRTVLIFDLGGGTFDVSLLSLSNGVFEVKATSGDTHLGGEDFDAKLMDWCRDLITKKYGKNIDGDDRAMRRLRTACERAKRALSNTMETTIEIDQLLDGFDFTTTITREQFETMCASYFTSTLSPVEAVLRDSKIDKSQVDEVVLVGGSTRIPKIQQLLSDYFDGKQLCCSIDPDEAVAFGATVQAALLSGALHPSSSSSSSLSSPAANFLLIDVTPLSLGLETLGGLMSKVIPRNSTIPCRQQRTFTTHVDGQEAVLVEIYEGERVRTCDNNKLGAFELSGIGKQQAAGVPQIVVTFDLDLNGILQVTAEERNTDIRSAILISPDQSRLSSEEIEQMMLDANQYSSMDALHQDMLLAKQGLYGYLFHVKATLKDEKFEKKMKEEEKEKMKKEVEEISRWLEGKEKEDEGWNKEEIEEKQKQLEGICQPILLKLYEGTTMPNFNEPLNSVAPILA